jgi:CrcB protein
MSWQTVLAIGSGGFIGAISRAYFTELVNKNVTFLILPLGTLFVNIIGSFILGSLLAYFYTSTTFSQTTKSFLATGILGSLTTYSTFATDTMMMFSINIYVAVLNILLNVAGTIVAATIGYKIIKYIII